MSKTPRRRAATLRGKPIAGTLIIEGDDPEEIGFLLQQDNAWRAKNRTPVHDPSAALDWMDARTALMLALDGRAIEWVTPKQAMERVIV